MREIGHKEDFALLVLTGLITLFGLLMLSSATAVLGYDKFGDSYWYLKHQLLSGLLPGLALFFIFSKIDYRVWKKIAPFLLAFSLALLLLVFVPGLGTSYGKARSWINIGGFSLQPAEVVKLTFLLYLAAWIEKRQERVHTFAYGFVPFLIYLGIIAVLIMLQPDTGTLFIIILISVGMYFAAGAKWKHLLALLAALLAGLVVLVKIAPYRMERLTAFVNPAADPQGIGYHINQALLAIGSGGWLGLGLGHSKQKFQYLPEVAGDSIFAVIAEELGFIVTVLVVILFMAIFYRMIRTAERCPDLFGHLVAAGVALWIGGQALVNVGAMLGLLPLTGLPLPLVSYGGTAMLSALAAIGIVVNISKYTKT